MTPIGGKSEFVVEVTAKGVKAVEDSVRRLLGGVRQVDTETKRVRRNTNELGRSFRNIALRTAAYIGIVRGFRAINNAITGTIKTGIQYNEVIEQSRLGIASLIAAQTDLVTSNGEILEGVEEMDAAYELATDQVRKLRIAGIQTAATTQELVDAFQQATGAGLAAGLSLDEIRQVTIRIAQAAGALGVPYRQLNEEIRSLLSGTIDQNTRIAKALQITNEQVRLAKEQNTLADFLLNKFEAFGVAGERIVETWGALRSNIKEAFELLSGEATFPLFEELRTRGLAQLARIFDFDTAEIADEFAQIIRDLQTVFGGIGSSLAGTMEGAVDAAQRFNEWLLANRDVVDSTVVGIGSFVSGIGEAVAAMTRITVGVVKWSVEMGIIAQTAETIGDIFRAIGRSPGLSALSTLGLTVGILAIIGSIIGPTASAVGVVAVAIVGLISGLDALSVSAAEATEEVTRLREAQTDLATETTSAAAEAFQLVAQYEALEQALRDGRVEEERVVDVQRQMVALLERLNTLSPEYARAVITAAALEGDYSDALRETLRLQDAGYVATLRDLDLLEESNRTRREAATAEIAANAARVPPQDFGPGGAAAAAGSRLAQGGTNVRLRDELIAIDEALASIAGQREDIAAARQEIARLLAAGAVTPDTPDTDGDSAITSRRAEIEANIASIRQSMREEEARLRATFEANKTSYVQYYQDLTGVQVSGLSEIAANYRELAGIEDDAARATQARTKAATTESQLRIKLLELTTAKENAAQQFLSQQIARDAQQLQAIGEIGEATRKRLEEQFREQKEVLANFGQFGIDETAGIDLFINRQVARAQLKELETQIAEVQQRVRARAEEIQGLVEIGAIDQQTARFLTALAFDEQVEILTTLIPLAEEYARIIGDPAIAAQVEALKAELAETSTEIAVLRDEWAEFRNAVADAAASNLANFLSEAVIEAETLGDAIKNLVGDLDGMRNMIGFLLADIVRLISRMIAMQIISASFAALGLPVPAGFKGGGLVRAATGGLLQGPGTGTSDSIVARVSAGEYVVRASSVKKYGPGFFHRLNAGSLPRDVTNLRRFATGGLVGGNVEPHQGKDFRGELTLGLEAGLVVDQMDSPAGERLVVKVVNKNRRSLFGG